MKHIMLDLETLGNGPTAAIIAIGAVKFDPEHHIISQNEFYTLVDARTCQEYGLTIDASTVEWWAQQSEESRSILWDKSRVGLYAALIAFNKFLVGGGVEWDELAIWGNGSTFDNVILRNAYHCTCLPRPWSDWQDFCFRTMKKMFPIDYKPDGIKHNALDDAKNQARWLCEIFRRIREHTL
jgi:hypothetical protein